MHTMCPRTCISPTPRFIKAKEKIQLPLQKKDVCYQGDKYFPKVSDLVLICIFH